jgi:hypothetical protein
MKSTLPTWWKWALLSLLGCAFVLIPSTASGQSAAEWERYKAQCRARGGTICDYYNQCGGVCTMPAPTTNSGSDGNSRGDRERETAAAEQRQREVELERQRIEAENRRRAEEAAARAKFEQEKREALGELKGISNASDLDSASALRGVGSTDSGLKGVSPADVGLKTMPARNYAFAGNGLIAGTTWTLYASRKPGEPEKRMCDVIKQQSKLAGSNYDAGVDCKRYQFVLGIAVSVDPFTDLSNRVAFDDLTNGQFSAQGQGLYDKLRGKRFDELGCHSNGAMICLAALENRDIQADHVVLYGPQVTRESLEVWNKLVQDGRIKSVKVYLNENDPIPGASIAYADYKKNQEAAAAAVRSNPSIGTLAESGSQIAVGAVSEVPLFQIDSLKRTINKTSPRLEVQTFPCKLDMMTTGCHAMTMYKSKVNCTGKSSGKSVPGTELRGKDELPEPPLPCEALGAKP